MLVACLRPARAGLASRLQYTGARAVPKKRIKAGQREFPERNVSSVARRTRHERNGHEIEGTTSLTLAAALALAATAPAVAQQHKATTWAIPPPASRSR